MNADNQQENSKPRGEHLKQYQWKKGQSGNILGRPKGPTLKEWSKSYLERMNDDERDEFMQGIPKLEIWKMSEGNAHTTEDKKISLTLPKPILGGTATLKDVGDTVLLEEMREEIRVEEEKLDIHPNDDV